MDTTEAAGEFLVDVAERLMLRCDPAPIRAMMARACGGQLDAKGPDGQRASTLTISGTPFEASVSGGKGRFTSAIRYVTETATQEMVFGSRVAAQLTAIRDLVAWLPNADEKVAAMLQSFVATLYPDPAKVSTRDRSATWIGIVHHPAAPQHAARLKVYGGLQIVPGAMNRLCTEWPGFAGLASVPDEDRIITPIAAAIEVDARGEVNHKVYLKTRYTDVAAPMKLVRNFGHQAWEVLSELVRHGVDPAELHRHNFFVCCSRGAGGSGFGLHLSARRDEDFTPLVSELASRHHGSTRAVNALAEAAECCGATWRYSAIGLGFSADHGIDKLNVYGTPTWGTA
ncbi:hypothetical protein LTT66_03030 [Nocardia gipuzkoensis]|uniref:hypothetical protein n=1 Tax=Nocardia gipuzkoensis TaxID=2749991 RepID=UPI001E5022D1|nr:hypothetical protein [Nocardia gipuzkoensis]UGT69202.1 hypothetical protein LTT66_03030 [Nocardia gipuzkoensis]